MKTKNSRWLEVMMTSNASFTKRLTAAASPFTASDAARAVSPLLSRRTMEEWLQGRRTPPEWTHEWIIARVSSAAKKARIKRSSPILK